MQDPIYTQITQRKRPSLTAASGFVLLAAAGLWLSVLASLLFSAGGMAMMALENALYYLPFVVLPIVIYAKRRPGLSSAMRLNPLPGLSALAIALLGLISVYLASGVATLWAALLDGLGLKSIGGLAVAANEGELALSIVTMAALPAVCEELLFRGIVLAAWETRGTAFAIGVTAALFALLHGNLYGLPVYMLVGCIAGFVTFALDSVYAGMIYHTVYNAACLVIPYLMSGQTEAAEAAASEGLGFAIALEFMMLASVTALLLVTLRLRGRDRLGVEPLPRVRRPLSGAERLTLAAAVLVMVGSTAVLAVLAMG